MLETDSSSKSFFGSRPIFLWITLGVIFILGFGIRLYDLTDPPLDFHATRQLFSAIISRGMYYQIDGSYPLWQQDVAVEAWQAKQVIEPRLFETLVALTYRIIGAEVIWVARIYSVFFWMAGGLALYLLAREMTSVDGAVIALAFYLLTPFGAIASRSFQPDPLMVLGILIAWWTFYRWAQTHSWKTAIVAGLSAGFAILVKSVAVFMLLGGMAALILVDRGWKKALRDGQVWLVAGLSALPVSIYMLYGLWAFEMESQFIGRFFPALLKDPAHYIQWGGEMMAIVGFGGLIAGLLGIFVFRTKQQRAFILGLWGGYGLFGLAFPYHFISHSYYHLPLIPIVALSLAPVAGAIFERIATLKLPLISRLAIIVVLLSGAVIQLWDIRVELAKDDYRHEVVYWAAVGKVLDHDANIIALTQDYGDRLAYYGWVNVKNWPDTGYMKYRDLRGATEFTFDDWFIKQTKGMDYFLVTRIREFARQNELHDRLYNHYPLVDEGEGYLLFDLTRPMNQ